MQFLQCDENALKSITLKVIRRERLGGLILIFKHYIYPLIDMSILHKFSGQINNVIKSYFLKTKLLF